jgi:5-methylcytosine-specific restriction endonuclease McrA
MTDAEFLAHVQSKYPKDVFIGKVTGQVRMYRRAWDHLREFIWNRDEGQCVNCGRIVVLDKMLCQSVHAAHIQSKGAGYNDLPSNVRSLCMQCHHDEHSGKAVAKGRQAPERACESEGT